MCRNSGRGFLTTVFAVLLLCCPEALCARNFQFQLYKGESSSGGRSYYYSNSAKKDTFKLTIGTASARDVDDEMEIRAATLLKDSGTKKLVINDIAKLRFVPARGRQVFYVTTGIANSSQGVIKGGVIIEIYQAGKLLKHWSSSTGPITKTQLKDSVKCAYIGGRRYSDFGSVIRSDFDNNVTVIVADENNPKPEASASDADKGSDSLPLSDFSMAMFRADATQKSMTRNATISISDDYYGPFSEAGMTHWSIAINLECSDGMFNLHGYALKSSDVGMRLKDLLKDGAPHHVVLKILRHSDSYYATRYVTVDDFCEIKDSATAETADDDRMELAASDYSYAMFKADASLNSITFPTRIRLSDVYSANFSNCQATHWSIEFYYPSGDSSWSMVYGYVTKESSVGMRIIDLVKDGSQHPVLIKVARSQAGGMGTRYVLIKDFKTLSADDPLMNKVGPSFSGSGSFSTSPGVVRRYYGSSSTRGTESSTAPKEDPEALLRAEEEHVKEMIRRRQSQR